MLRRTFLKSIVAAAFAGVAGLPRLIEALPRGPYQGPSFADFAKAMKASPLVSSRDILAEAQKRNYLFGRTTNHAMVKPCGDRMAGP